MDSREKARKVRVINMKCELTREEYYDTIKSLNNNFFKSFNTDNSAGISFNNDIKVLERFYSSENNEEEKYYQYEAIPAEYTKPPQPSVKIKINNWKEMQQLFNEISKLQKEFDQNLTENEN